MKMKKWLKCLLMTMALMMVVNVGTVSTTIPAAAKASTESVKVGKKFWSGKFQYKVTSLKGETGTATLIGTKSKKLTSVNVPETVKTGKYTLTVDAIGDGAFKNCKKLKTVATNESIKKIGKNAFSGCSKLATMDIKSKELKSVGKDALKGISKEAVVTVPEGTGSSYEEILKVDVVAPETPAAAAVQETVAETAAPAPAAAAPQTEAATPAAAQESAPAAKTPAASAPVATAPQTTVPAAKTPAASAPAATAPQTTVPAAKTPAATTSQTNASAKQATPQTTAPAAKTPAAATPQTNASAKQATPQTNAPAAKTPAATTQETSAPAKQATPQTNAPAAKTPAATTQETTAPAKQATPETNAPTAKTPAATTPQTNASAKQTTQETTAPAKQATQETTAPAKQTTQETSAPAAVETEHVCEFTNWVVTKEPYCGYLGYDMTWRNTGEEVGTCAVCGKTKTRGIRVEQHEFELVSETAATCEKAGVKTFKCKLCGYQTTEPNGEALGHDMQQHDDPATCTEDGRSYQMCSRCGLVTDEVVTATKTGHDFSTYQTVKEASCTEEGLRESVCAHEGCDEKQTERIPKKEHSYTVTEVPETCASDRKIVSTCGVCGYESVEYVHGTKKEHELEDEEIMPSTTTTEGYIRRRCLNCEHVEKHILPLSTHTHKWVAISKLNEDRPEGEKLHEGILASMSGGKMRTEQCVAKLGDSETCHDMRYTYHTEENCGTFNDGGTCEEDSHWTAWEDLPCNGNGHTWTEDSHTCKVCGMTKPGTEKGVGVKDPGYAESRIVWSIKLKANVGGAEEMLGEPTAISADHFIDYTAPVKDGYVFTGWTWSRDDAIPEGVFSDPETKTSLHVSCDYMNVTFTANYNAAAPASEEPAAISVDPNEMPTVVHEHVDLSHVDFSDGQGDAAGAHGHEEHEVTTEHDLVMEEE